MLLVYVGGILMDRREYERIRVNAKGTLERIKEILENPYICLCNDLTKKFEKKYLDGEQVLKDKKYQFFVSFFEIYSGRLYDLLNNRNILQVLDDKKGKVQIYGLIEIQSDSREQMHSIIDNANNQRTTHNTVE